MAMTNYDVIFIDDEPTMTDIFQQYVKWKYSHWRACSFNNPVDLYNKILADQVSAVVWIVDIMMPGRNGGEIAEAIQHESAPGTIIIGYTALDLPTLDSRAEFKGKLIHFTRIISKQENFGDLLELVDTWVKQGKP
jgi:DNA-binding NarL/FixJ family response regulator